MASLIELMAPLARLAARRLPSMFDSGAGLFSHKTVRTADGFRNVGVNARYSGAVVVGVAAAQRAGLAAPDVPLGATVDSLVRLARGGVDTATAGGILWALAALDDSRAAEVLPFLRPLADNPERSATVDLAVALSGLSSCAASFPALRTPAAAMARPLADALTKSIHPRAGLFPLCPAVRSLHSAAFSRTTSAASQFYPLHALFLYGRHVANSAPTAAAAVARRLVDLQGPAGQWWWIYGLPAGRVVEGYPVYSVHQDGMAIFALAPYQEQDADPFEPALAKGVRWMHTENELRRSLVHEDEDFIFRCVQRKRSDADFLWGMSRARAVRTVAASLLGLSADRPEAPAHDLEVLEECRSYHLGWLLYAWALVQTGRPQVAAAEVEQARPDGFNPALFHDAHWDAPLTALQRRRLERTADALPGDAQRIIDVGGGNGRLLDEAAKRRPGLTGVVCDLSPPALARCRHPAVLGAADRLPFRDGAADCVVCSEVLEHLPEDMRRRAAAELTRVGSGRLLVTTPFREQLRRNWTRCPRCRHIFHITGHLASFDRQDLAPLFPGFETVRLDVVEGGVGRRYSERLLDLKQNRLSLWAWRPDLVCPSCGNRTFPRPGRTWLRWVIAACNAALHPARTDGGWLLALFRKPE